MKQTREQGALVSLGMQAIVPGLETAINTLQAELDRIREALGFARNGNQSTAEAGIDITTPIKWSPELGGPVPADWQPKRRYTKRKVKAEKRPRVPVPKPPRDRPSVADDEPPSGWMTSFAAAEKLGMSIAAFRSMLTRGKWMKRTGRDVRARGNNRPLLIVRVTDVDRELALRKAGARQHGGGRRPRPGRPEAKPKYRNVPAKTEDGWYTKVGVAQELGIGVSTVEKLQRDKKLDVKYVHGRNKGSKLATFNPEDVARIKEARAAA